MIEITIHLINHMTNQNKLISIHLIVHMTNKMQWGIVLIISSVFPPQVISNSNAPYGRHQSLQKINFSLHIHISVNCNNTKKKPLSYVQISLLCYHLLYEILGFLICKKVHFKTQEKFKNQIRVKLGPRIILKFFQISSK